MAEQNQKDFVLPNEQKTTTATGTTAQTVAPAETPQGRQPISGKELLIGSCIVIIGAFLFFFIKGWFTESMIRKRKSPASANRAGWALFFFLTFTTALLVFGFLGGLWSNLLFVIPMAIFTAVSLIFFIISAISR
jgi:hypothetical protein